MRSVATTHELPVRNARESLSERDISHARRVARVLDNDFVDPLIGMLLPGIGDVLGSVAGLYIVVLAVRRRVSRLVIARMLLNLGLDALFGLVPVVGDIVDFKFKANRRNADLLAARVPGGGRSHPHDWLVLFAALAVFVGAITAVIWGITALVRLL